MMDPAIQLLRESAQREVACDRPPAEVLASLRAVTDRKPNGAMANQRFAGSIDAPRFMLTLPSGPKATRYPGAVYGVVEPAGAGSRLVYRVDIPWHIRLVLRVWALISVALIVLGLFMAVTAIIAGEFQSVFFSLWLPAFVVIVWLHWRRLGSRAQELDEHFRQLVGAGPEIERAAQQ